LAIVIMLIIVGLLHRIQNETRGGS
jgi:hypothetical protein